MILYCTLELKGINTKEQFNKICTGTNQILCLDDIHFVVPDPYDKQQQVNIHLDFNIIDGCFENEKYIVRFKELADTWIELNEKESNITREDITIDLLAKGYVENYVMYFEMDNGDTFVDIKINNIGYYDNHNYYELNIDSDAINEA